MDKRALCSENCNINTLWGKMQISNVKVDGRYIYLYDLNDLTVLFHFV
jgi:hypothetical protein